MRPLSIDAKVCWGATLCLFIGCLAAGCSTLSNLFKLPTGEVQDVRLTSFDEQGADLDFAIRVTNPNAVSVDLGGYQYELEVAGQTLAKGTSDAGMSLAAQGENVVQVPVRMDYSSLIEILGALANQKTFDYRFASTLQFQAPWSGGTVSVPLSQAGEMPVVRPPRIRFGGLSVEKLNLTGAELNLSLEVVNPNAFAWSLAEMKYEFGVNGTSWANVDSVSPMELKPDESAVLRLPVTLNFLEQGRAAYQILSGRGGATYNLDGAIKLTSPLPLLKELKLPFNQSGPLTFLGE